MLHQNKHRQRGPALEPGCPNLHVLLTVVCPDGVLGVTPAASEGAPAQISALKLAVGCQGAADVRTICSDKPEDLDAPGLKGAFRNLQRDAKDPLRPATKVEQATGGRATAFSWQLRRCSQKFRKGYDDKRGYHWEGSQGQPLRSLRETMRDMSVSASATRAWRIATDARARAPYTSCTEFVNDVAALAKTLPHHMERKVDSRTTVLTSLEDALQARKAHYLMNLARFTARNKNTRTIYGTTPNEVFHLQVKAFYRNVMKQTGRNASNVAAILTLAKLVSLHLSKSDLTREHKEKEFLSAAATHLAQTPMTWQPKMDHSTAPGPTVHRRPAAVHRRPGAQRRKRPESDTECQQIRKRPATEMHGRPCVAGAKEGCGLGRKKQGKGC